MPRPTPRAPQPALSDHPAFALMLLATLEKFRCTLGEVREDYWLGRVWRALGSDPALAGCVAREGPAGVLLTGPGFAVAPPSALARAMLWLRVGERIAADTGRSMESLGLGVRWAEGRVEVATTRVRSLLAQATADDPRWGDLTPYAGDLTPVAIPMVQRIQATAVA